MAQGGGGSTCLFGLLAPYDKKADSLSLAQMAAVGSGTGSSLLICFKYFKMSSMLHHVSTFGVSRGHDDRFARGFFALFTSPIPTLSCPNHSLPQSKLLGCTLLIVLKLNI